MLLPQTFQKENIKSDILSQVTIKNHMETMFSVSLAMQIHSKGVHH